MRTIHNPDLLGEAPPVQRLVVAPHADDETLGCGGLLAKYPDECAVVVLAEPDDVRAKEFEAAQEVLGYRRAYFLDQPDGYLGSDMHRLVGLLDRVLEICRPHELYLPYPAMHQDHVAAYEAGMRSARLSMHGRHWFPPNVLVYDVAAYDLTLFPTDLRWNVFEALEEAEVDKKVEALLAYASQQVPGPHPANGLKELAHALGVARQVTWAEQYALVRAVRTRPTLAERLDVRGRLSRGRSAARSRVAGESRAHYVDRMTSTGAADSPNSEKPWSLGDRLRVSRCSARLTIRDMGQRLGVASEVVNGYERELTPVPDAVVTAYADVTGVSQDWIRTGAGDPPPLHGDGS